MKYITIKTTLGYILYMAMILTPVLIFLGLAAMAGAGK
jgi:hypothetical protein